MQQSNEGRFAPEFRETAVRRYLSTDISYRRLGESMGVSAWTLRGWVKQYQRSAVSSHKKTSKPAPEAQSTESRTAEEKLSLLLRAKALPDEELGEFLRQEGIREGDLERWEQEALGGIERGPAEAGQSRRMRELEGRLRKSEKRLKEADALLELQKKVQALWEAEDDDTPKS